MVSLLLRNNWQQTASGAGAGAGGVNFFQGFDPKAYSCSSRWTCTHVYTGTSSGLSWWGHEFGREGGEEG